MEFILVLSWISNFSPLFADKFYKFPKFSFTRKIPERSNVSTIPPPELFPLTRGCENDRFTYPLLSKNNIENFFKKNTRWKVSSLIIKIATIYVHDTYIQDTRFDRLIRSTVSRFDRYAIQSNDCVWIKVSLGSLDLEWSAPPPPCHHRSIIGGVNEAVRFPLFPRSVCAGARYRQVSINRRIHVYIRVVYTYVRYS